MEQSYRSLVSIYFLLCNMCSVSYPAVTTKLMSNCYPCLQMGVVQVGLGYPHHHPGHGTAPVMHPPSPGRFACTNTWGHWVSVTILEASRDCTLQAYMHTCECDREGGGKATVFITYNPNRAHHTICSNDSSTVWSRE